MRYRYDIQICPTCGGNLATEHVKGSDVPSLVCLEQHRFYASDHSFTYTSNDPPEDMDEVEASQLIQNPRYCHHIPGQVRWILRRIEEIDHGFNVPHQPYDKVFRVCPRCGSDMEGCDASDCWCAGLRCQNGHHFDYRNGLAFIEGTQKTQFTLVEEMPDETVVFLARRYVEDPGNESLKAPRGALVAMKQFLRTR